MVSQGKDKFMVLGNPNSTFNTTVMNFQQVPGSFSGAPLTSGATYIIRMGNGTCRVNKVTGFVHCPTVNTTGQDMYEQFYTIAPSGTLNLTAMINTGDFFLLRSKATRKYCRAITGASQQRQEQLAAAPALGPGPES